MFTSWCLWTLALKVHADKHKVIKFTFSLEMTGQIKIHLLLISLIPICALGQNPPRICLGTGADSGVCYEGSWKSFEDLRYASFQG